MSERNGKKQTRTRGQQKKGIKMARDQQREVKKKKMDGLNTGKLGRALGGTGSLLPFFRLYLSPCTQKPHFISFFLQKSAGCTSRSCCFS